MRRVFALIAGAAIVGVALTGAQTRADDEPISLQPGGRLVATNTTLRQLIAYAYGPPRQSLPSSQMSGGPKWIDADRFDLIAKAAVASADVAPPRAAMVAMLQRLLEERFKLTVHHETQELPVYAFVIAKVGGQLGAQLHRATVDCRADATGPPAADQRLQNCGLFGTRPGQLNGRSTSLSMLAENLSGVVGRPVLDRTGLTGPFDLELAWTPDQLSTRPESRPDLPLTDLNGPSLFTAIQEQLGLKLESTRGPVDVLVIDSAQEPTSD